MRFLQEQGDATTNATPIDSLLWQVPENCAARAVLTVVARGETGGGRATFKREALVSRAGTGAPVIDAVTTNTDAANAAAAGWAISVIVEGNALRARLTGGASVVVDWQLELDGVIVVSPA
jgi:hypothetical protein